MEKLNELVEALYPKYGAPGSRDVDVTARRKAIDESAAAIAEAFRALEQENILLKQGCENNPLVHEMIDWRERAEAAVAYTKSLNNIIDTRERDLRAAEAKLAELEKQEPASSTTKAQLNIIADGSVGSMFASKDMPVKLFTRPAPAINLAELVPGECIPAHYTFSGEQEGEEHPRYAEGFNACRAAILRNFEEAE